MKVPFRKQVKIVPAAESPENAEQQAPRRERDTRPGRFTIKGSFIKLPGTEGANTEERRA